MPTKKPDPRAAIAAATDNAEIVGALKRLMNQKKKVWVSCHECGTKVGVETLDSAVQMRAVQTWITEGFGKQQNMEIAVGPASELQILAEFSADVRQRALEELRVQLAALTEEPPEGGSLPGPSDGSLLASEGVEEVEDPVPRVASRLPAVLDVDGSEGDDGDDGRAEDDAAESDADLG